ncbi:uncharacterized protein LOC133823409 [Humulus lupulus]|uniref:uncharacterized protein LOC133823409 n=1 Tax=Humulus lupulus TaxID=3486 RepID=UPI002B401905|nr:uncharacterized protein LOC133823409 [Humulus lupulus]
MEKVAFCLILASRKLRPYFQSHSIHVMTDQPLRQVLQKPEASGRLLKRAIELSQFEILYIPQTTIKSQTLAECTGFQKELLKEPIQALWRIFVDGSSNENGSRAGIILITPEGHRFHSALRFEFEASSNEAEYEALLAGLRMAKELKIRVVQCYSDSRLVVNQVSMEYQARGAKMAAYLAKVKKELSKFEYGLVDQIPCEQNANTDTLARHATSKEVETLSIVPVEFLESPSVAGGTTEVEMIDIRLTWMTPIIEYLTTGKFPDELKDARRILYQASRYVIVDGALYRRSHSLPLLRCVLPEEARTILQEVHEGFCGDHVGGKNLTLKILRQGYYWPTLSKDSISYVRKCDKCQLFATVSRALPVKLKMISSPWPFAVWGIDLIGALPMGKGGVCYAVVAIDYFRKWAKVEPLAKITSKRVLDFVVKNIVCQFRLPKKIVSNNGTQFDSDLFTKFCERHVIIISFSSVAYSQANGQVQTVNKTLKESLKKRLDEAKGVWPKQLSQVLWVYRTSQ